MLKKLMKMVYIVLGFISLGFGLVGVILPVIPTTPLLLLASFLFVKGSDRFDRWFKSTNIYKRHLESFVKEKAMTLKQKVFLLLFADAMIAIPLFTLDSLFIKVFLLLVIVYKYYYFIYKIKTIPPTR